MTYTPPLANPQPFGLYSAASLLDAGEPSRLSFGLTMRDPHNHGSVSSVALDRCDASERIASERPVDTGWNALLVWAADDCGGLLGDLTEQTTRAEQLLRLLEPVEAEKHVAGLLAAAAPTPATATTLADALGLLEQHQREHGYTGVIHAASKWGPVAVRDRLTVGSAAWSTPFGNRWAFGGGYTALDNTLYITGPVTVWRSAVTVADGIDPRHNARAVIADREILVAWQADAYAVTITPEVTP